MRVPNQIHSIPFTVRSVYVIDPAKKIRLTLTYPASTGRQFDEILRVIDSLQLGDKNKITTPANWTPGDRVIVHPSVKVNPLLLSNASQASTDELCDCRLRTLKRCSRTV